MEDGNIKAKFENWFNENNIQEVEIVVCDFAGIARGKMLPKDKFVQGLGGKDLKN